MGSLTRTRKELRDEIRHRGDLRGGDGTGRHPDAKINRDIDQSIAELYRLLIKADPDWFIQYKDHTVTANTQTYDLPSKDLGDSFDFYKGSGVDVEDAGKYYPLGKALHSERAKYQTGGSTKRSTRYRIMGGKLWLYPIPDWSGTVRQWYHPAPELLAADTSTFDGIAGFEEFVVVDCVIKARMRDEDDPADWVARKNTMIAQILDEGSDLDAAEPDRIRRVEGELEDIDLLGLID